MIVVVIGVVDEGRDHAQEYEDCTAVTQRCTLFMYSHPLPPRVYHEKVVLLLLEPLMTETDNQSIIFWLLGQLMNDGWSN